MSMISANLSEVRTKRNGGGGGGGGDTQDRRKSEYILLSYPYIAIHECVYTISMVSISPNARDGTSDISRDPNTKSHIVAENDFLGLQNTLEIVYGLISISTYVKTSYVPSVLHTGTRS